MSETPDRYLTSPLTKEQLLHGVTDFGSFLQKQVKEGVVLAQYGWGCNLHPALCYRDMEVGVGWFGKFIADSIRQEIVVLGDSDFTIAIPEDRLTIVFCHEGDIHVRGTDNELQETLWSQEPFKNFPLVRAPNLPEPAQPKKPWF